MSEINEASEKTWQEIENLQNIKIQAAQEKYDRTRAEYEKLLNDSTSTVLPVPNEPSRISSDVDDFLTGVIDGYVKEFFRDNNLNAADEYGNEMIYDDVLDNWLKMLENVNNTIKTTYRNQKKKIEDLKELYNELMDSVELLNQLKEEKEMEIEAFKRQLDKVVD